MRRDGISVKFGDGQRLAVAAPRDGLLIVDKAYGRGLAAPPLEIAGMLNLDDGEGLRAAAEILESGFFYCDQGESGEIRKRARCRLPSVSN
jgi:hypothetical protein